MYNLLASLPRGASHGVSPCGGRGQPKLPKGLPTTPARSGRRTVVESPPKERCGTKRCGATSLAEALAPQPAQKKTREMPKAAIGATQVCTAQKKTREMPKAAIGATQVCKVFARPRLSNPLDTGSVFESDLVHVKRHRLAGQAGGCLRCIFVSNPRALEQVAKLPRKAGHVASWLEPGPCSEGGQWALGCRICAWYHIHNGPTMDHRKGAIGPPGAESKGGPKRKHVKKIFKDPALRMRKHARFGKFANFTFRQPSQTEKAIEQHGNSQAHDLAYKAMLQKESACELRPLTMPEAAPNPVAQKAFKGRVPKPRDWLDSFVDTGNLVSWRKQARLRVQKSGQSSGEPLASKPEVARASDDTTSSPWAGSQPLAADQGGSQSLTLAAPRETLENLRKRRRKQTRIMAEVVRRKHRRILGKAKFCTLALDEAQGRKLVHFRCDCDKAPWYHQGTLGVYKAGPQTTEEGEEDHAKRAVKRLDEFLTKFCTPLRKASLGTACDNEFKEHLLNIVATISADGGAAERRAIFLAGAKRGSL
jgi:hypothetical protein